MPAVSGHTTDTIQYSQSPGVLQGNLDCFVLQATAMKLDPYLARRIIGRVPVLPISGSTPGGPIAIRTSHPATSRGSSQGHYGTRPLAQENYEAKPWRSSANCQLPIAPDVARLIELFIWVGRTKSRRSNLPFRLERRCRFVLKQSGVSPKIAEPLKANHSWRFANRRSIQWQRKIRNPAGAYASFEILIFTVPRSSTSHGPFAPSLNAFSMTLHAKNSITTP
jgi:hypothetical protein